MNEYEYKVGMVQNDSDLETLARESIGQTVEEILQHFKIDIAVEEAIRKRDW